MPADPPPSLLMTPDRRRRLSQLFAEARQLAAQPRYDARRIHDLLAQCVRADPGNIVYLDELLANLKRRDAERRSWWSRLIRSWRTVREKKRDPREMQSSQQWLNVGPDLLWNGAESPQLFSRLAAAAADLDFDEVELRFLSVARQLAPDDPEILRELARTLTRQGRFEEAVGPWHAVAALCQGDREAEQAIEDLRLAVRATDLQPPSSSEPSTTSGANSDLLAKVQATVGAGRLAAAEQLLSQAQAAQGADLEIFAQRQSVRLSASAQRVETARLRAQHDVHAKAQLLVQRLEDDHRRLEIELLALQTERFPGDIVLRLQLADRLRQAGNFSGAIHVLEETLRTGSDNPQIYLTLGECRQQLRQFEPALACYLEAIELAQNSAASSELLTLARYRAGVLAAAMGQLPLAREQFAAIIAESPDYRDAKQRLQSLSNSDSPKGSGTV